MPGCDREKALAYANTVDREVISNLLILYITYFSQLKFLCESDMPIYTILYLSFRNIKNHSCLFVYLCSRVDLLLDVEITLHVKLQEKLLR